MCLAGSCTDDKLVPPSSNGTQLLMRSILARTWQIIHNNDSMFKLNFKFLCNSYGIKTKPTRIKNLQANTVLEQLYEVSITMLHATEVDMANIGVCSDIIDFLRGSMLHIQHSTQSLSRHS